MKTITESEMTFGPFQESNLFHIEESEIYKKLGQGVKTVEFILRNSKDNVCFLEAKKSCPNADNRDETDQKRRKFEEYYSSITEKFTESLQIYLASILKLQDNFTEIGSNLMIVGEFDQINLVFILVIKNAKNEWLAGPKAELNRKLRTLRKIWNIKVIVLNEQQARIQNLRECETFSVNSLL